MVEQRTLTPLVKVRVLVPQPFEKTTLFLFKHPRISADRELFVFH
jgi:hypothetical protein